MLISGISYQVANWRTSFWVTAVIYTFFTIAAYFTVPKDEAIHEPFNLETLKKFDYLGTLLAVAGIALLTSALRCESPDPQKRLSNDHVVLLQMRHMAGRRPTLLQCLY